MEQRRLGANGPAVTVVGLGCNNFGGRTDLEKSRLVIDRAIDLGINLLDTADIYGNRGGSEDIIGQALGAKRDKVLIATKFAGRMDDSGALQGGSRKYVISAVEASLRRLRTDRIDLYQMHFPDDGVPIEETLRGLDDVVKQGKVRYIGCSNFAAWQMVDAIWTSKHDRLASFVSSQDEYSLVARDLESDRLPAIEKFGLGFIPYSPLAGGLLSGKYRRNEPLPKDSRLTDIKSLQDRFFTEPTWTIVERLEQFASEHGHTMLELAFSWLASRSAVSSIIAGATKPEQVDRNVAAVNWKLNDEDLEEIDKITARA
jgi:aryl-alcohol dehydrogenase-like predicted oxidoreductase